MTEIYGQGTRDANARHTHVTVGICCLLQAYSRVPSHFCHVILQKLGFMYLHLTNVSKILATSS